MGSVHVALSVIAVTCLSSYLSDGENLFAALSDCFTEPDFEDRRLWFIVNVAIIWALQFLSI